MNTNLLNALKEIISRYGGVETLSNARRVKALLADLAAGEPKPQKNALTACLEQGFSALLQNVSAGERGTAKTKLAERLNREEGLDPALCADTLDLLEAALFGEVSAKAAPPGTAVPGTPAPQNTYYLSVNYQQTGPFTLEQVKSMIGGGSVSKEYWIRAASGSNWMPVTAMPELQAFFGGTGTGKNSITAPKPAAPSPQTPPQSPHYDAGDDDFEDDDDDDDDFEDYEDEDNDEDDDDFEDEDNDEDDDDFEDYEDEDNDDDDDDFEDEDNDEDDDDEDYEDDDDFEDE